MIEFVNTENRIKAYFFNPLTEESRLIGSCELFVSEEAIAHWKECIQKGYFGQISPLLDLMARIQAPVL